MLKVLLVDDEPFVTKGLRVLIDWTEHGFEVCGEASSGEEAVQLIKELSPHIVITDIKMPDIDGLELIRHVKTEMHLDIDFIILSGYAEFKYAQSAMKYNVTHYILKPINQSELISILKTISKKIEEKSRVENERSLGIQALTDKLIKKAIKGECDEKSTKKLSSFLGIPMNERIVLIMVVLDDFENWMNELDDEEIQQKLSSIRLVLENTVSPRYKNQIFEIDADQYGILINHTILRINNCSIAEFCQQLKNNINKNIQCRTSIFIGKEVHGISGLQDAYNSLLATMNYRLFKGKDIVVSYNNIRDLSFSYKYNVALSHPFSRLLEAIELNDITGIKTNITQLINEVIRDTPAPEILKAYISNLALEILSIVSKTGGQVDLLLKESPILSLSFDKYTIYDIKEILIHFSIKSAEYISILKEKQTTGIISQVEDYISKNYNKNLKLKSLAERFYVNATYLGQLFKKTHGMYFNDYLLQIRIEKAKKLLRRTNMKVYEIAHSVGFTNADYFISKFSKIAGITPSEYRSSNPDIEA